MLLLLLPPLLLGLLEMLPLLWWWWLLELMPAPVVLLLLMGLLQLLSMCVLLQLVRRRGLRHLLRPAAVCKGRARSGWVCVWRQQHGHQVVQLSHVSILLLLLPRVLLLLVRVRRG